jgi:hypothetical protein
MPGILPKLIAKPQGAMWPTCRAQHTWEHYRFTGGKAFPDSLYSVMMEAVLFCAGWLVKNPTTGI